MQETQVQCLGQEDPLERAWQPMPVHSCLENCMDRGTWWTTVRTTVHSIKQSWTQLSNLGRTHACKYTQSYSTCLHTHVGITQSHSTCYAVDWHLTYLAFGPDQHSSSGTLAVQAILPRGEPLRWPRSQHSFLELQQVFTECLLCAICRVLSFEQNRHGACPQSAKSLARHSIK